MPNRGMQEAKGLSIQRVHVVHSTTFSNPPLKSHSLPWYKEAPGLPVLNSPGKTVCKLLVFMALTSHPKSSKVPVAAKSKTPL